MGDSSQPELWDRVEAVLASGRWIGLVCTGGGSQLVAWLLNHPGASRAIVEAQIPYHAAALAAYLGAPGPHRVASLTAVHLAAEAWVRVGRLTGQSAVAVGLGCTAALATRRRRRGLDRAVLAARTAARCTLGTLEWDRGMAARLAQEEVLSRTALAMLGQACGLVPQWPAWPAGVRFAQRVVAIGDPLGLLYAGDVPCVERSIQGRWTTDVPRPRRLLLPGSFNPLHYGHIGLLAAAERVTGRTGACELSIENVDKPRLDPTELARRAAQFTSTSPLVCTRAATFVEKARLFADCVFVIGFDTAVRLLQPGYYGGREQLRRAFADMADAGARFLVAGRLVDGAYRSLQDLDVPAGLPPLFGEIPATLFQMDISSTQLRARLGRGPGK